ncbi:MAG TPA: hypothetical protein VL098_10550 [Flavipsychrobacter sp.]|nr:hypothetical protein [Flavipsychrobacter sp.]
MKKQKSRELLLITKAAQKWDTDFDENVDKLMSLVSKVDNELYNELSCELLDVYSKKQKPVGRRIKRMDSRDNRPFEFLVYRN